MYFIPRSTLRILFSFQSFVWNDDNQYEVRLYFQFINWKQTAVKWKTNGKKLFMPNEIIALNEEDFFNWNWRIYSPFFSVIYCSCVHRLCECFFFSFIARVNKGTVNYFSITDVHSHRPDKMVGIPIDVNSNGLSLQYFLIWPYTRE